MQNQVAESEARIEVVESFWQYYRPALVYLGVAVGCGLLMTLGTWVPAIHEIAMLGAFLIYPAFRTFQVGGIPRFNLALVPETVVDSWVESDFNGNPVRKYRVVEGARDPWHSAANSISSVAIRFLMGVAFLFGFELICQGIHLIRARRLWNSDGTLLTRSANWSEYPALLSVPAIALTLVWYWGLSKISRTPPVMEDSVIASYQEVFRPGHILEFQKMDSNGDAGLRFVVLAHPHPTHPRSGLDFSLEQVAEASDTTPIRYTGVVYYMLPGVNDYPISLSQVATPSEQQRSADLPEHFAFRRIPGELGMIDALQKWKLTPTMAEMQARRGITQGLHVNQLSKSSSAAVR